ncbi:hypothetical protein IOC61_02900 [Halomonas sp. KAO]|uniref:hypothetical protein n=1 Tax=Halomonas TaxID=2745 RepID=UPI000AA4BE65|nr:MULTISPECIES: hypothetical protein [Halomonas]MBF7052263.1 hypothetical protein [Halomonas sp. KAO]MDT0501279.1 hypothetical protein [Halomonas sp. PAR7]MDT0512197.1 hypothetical protein [Halomonas sp. LES1]MDT0590666.1 hypothetical protein [Halomonas sp. PAR8]
MTCSAPYRCPYCGALAWREPREIEPPVDYCHGDAHGSPEEYREESSEVALEEDLDADA